MDLFQPGDFISFGQTKPTLIQAASLIPVKNQRLLLEILQLAAKERAQLSLNLIGSGVLQADLFDLARRLGVADRIVWHQQVAYPEMPAHYRAAHVYLQTSRHESQGMSVLEAMACGLPAIGTPVGVVKTMACLPAQESVAALATQVVELFGDEVRYRQFRQQAREQVEREFSLRASITRFTQLYDHVRQ
jgi:glycosyltransferase involved in cell wall biosynthesis